MKIVYILNEFPKISETFILNELLEVQSICALEVFAFVETHEPIVHPSVKLVQCVRFFSKTRFLIELRSHFFLFFRYPVKYIKTFFLAINQKNQVFRLFLLRLSCVCEISNSRPQHIHAHYGGVASNMAMLVHLLTGINYTFTTHRYDIFNFPPTNYKIKSNLAKKHITVSEFNKKYIIQRFGVFPDKISVVHCGIGFNHGFPGDMKKNENVIVSIARLTKQKALHNLIHACHNLKKHNIPFTCLIAGEGSQRHYLEGLIESFNLRNEIKLLGSLTQDKVFALLSSAKIYVLPSRSEGISVSLMEAMAMKVPVIGPNVCGIPELIEDGACGFLVQPDNVEELAEKIELLLSNDSLRSKFSEAAYSKVFNEFNLHVEVQKLINIWKKT